MCVVGRTGGEKKRKRWCFFLFMEFETLACLGNSFPAGLGCDVGERWELGFLPCADVGVGRGVEEAGWRAGVYLGKCLNRLHNLVRRMMFWRGEGVAQTWLQTF